MKKGLLFLVGISILFCSCSRRTKVDIESYEKEIDLLLNAEENKKKFSHYEKVTNILEEIEKQKDELSFGLDKEDHDKNSSYLENLHWKVKTSFFQYYQSQMVLVFEHKRT